VPERGGKGGLEVLVAAEALEGQPLDGAVLLVVDVVSNDEDDLLHLVLHELEGALDLLLVGLLGEALADDLDALAQPLPFLPEALR
jgi:hypothetical protein